MFNFLLASSSKAEAPEGSDVVKFTSFPAPGESRKKTSLLNSLSLTTHQDTENDEAMLSLSGIYATEANDQDPPLQKEAHPPRKKLLIATSFPQGDNPRPHQSSAPTIIPPPYSREYWMPDRLCRMCYECELPFNVFRRKHHCRFCGQIFCHSCSSYFVDGRFFLLVGMVRACRLCHNQIVNNQERTTTIDHTSGSKANLYYQRRHQQPSSEATTKKNETTTSTQTLTGKGWFSKKGKGGMDTAGLDGPMPQFDENGSKSASASTDEGTRLILSSLRNTREQDETNWSSFARRSKDSDQNVSKLSVTNGSSSHENEARSSSLRVLASERLEQMVKQLLRSDWSLRNQSLNLWSRVVLHLAQHVCNNIDPDVRINDDDMDVRTYVKIKTIPGGSSRECVYVDGIVFRKDVVHKNMRMSSCNPRILLIAGGIEFQRSHSKLSSFLTLTEQEQKYTQIIVEKIVRLEPQIVLVGQSISRQAQECLRQHDMIVIQHVKPKVMHKIARLTGSRIFTSTDHVASMGQHVHTSLGTCHRFQTVAFPSQELIGSSKDACGKKKQLIRQSMYENGSTLKIPQIRRARGHGYSNFLYFSGCPRILGCTLILRGASKSVLAKIKSTVSFTVFLAYHLRLECSFFSDCGVFISSPQYDQTPALNRQQLVSISLAVDFRIRNMPFPSPNRTEQEDAMWRWRESSPYYHQSIVVTTLWMQQQSQLSSAVIRGYVYYTAHDICLGQFLLDICFDSKINVDAKRLCDLKQLMYHNDGMLEISVRRGSDSNQSIPQYSSQIEQKDATNFQTWSFCKKCERVHEKLPLSEDSWRLSFGKFLEITFYNHLALSCTCEHSIQRDHILYFGWRSYVIQIEYFRVKPMDMCIRQCLPFDRVSYQKELVTKYSDLRKISQNIHASILEKNNELRILFISKKESMEEYMSVKSNQMNDASAVLDESNLKSDIEFVSSALETVKTEIQLHVQWMDNHIESELEKFEGSTGIFGGHPGKLRRELFVRATNWNRRMSLIGHYVKSMDPSQIDGALAEPSSSSFVAAGLFGGPNSLDELKRLQAFAITSSTLATKLDDNCVSNTYEDDEDMQDSEKIAEDSQSQLVEINSKRIDDKYFVLPNESPDVGDDVPAQQKEHSVDDKSAPSTSLPVQDQIIATDEETPVMPPSTVASISDNSDSFGLKDIDTSKAKRDRVERAVSGSKRNYKLPSALARLLGKDSPEEDPWIVSLNDLQHDCYPLDGLWADDSQDEVMLVHEEQLTSIISYSLSTSFYKKSLQKMMMFIESQHKTPTVAILQEAIDKSVLSDQGTGYSVNLSKENLRTDTSGIPDVPSHRKVIDQSEQSESMTFPKGSLSIKDDPLIQNGFHVKFVQPEVGVNPCKTNQAKNHEQVARLKMSMLSSSKTHIKHRFADVDDHGNTTCKFVCHAYWSAQFSAIRKSYFGDNTSDEVDFLRSLSMARPWNAQGGKSGATFLKTTDGRFVVKRITRTELQMFLEYAPAYFEYQSNTLFKNYATVLVKVLGVFQIGSHNRITGKRVMEQVVIMQNLFYERTIKLVFDLKGSTRSRYARVMSATEQKANVSNIDANISNNANVAVPTEPQPVLLDENFLEFSQGKPLPLRDISRLYFTNAVLNDTLFLSLINVVDYSILIGMDEAREHLVVGIIDYMRQYDIIKKVERMGKSVGMIAGQAEPTVIQPPNYKNRFQAAMDRYFMMVPDKLTPFRMGWGDTAFDRP